MRSPSQNASVLVAGYDHYAVLAAVRALRAAGYTPWLAASEPGTYAEKSRATAGTVLVPDPEVDGEGFVRGLAAAAARLSVAAVLPSMEAHFLTLAGREAEFPSTAVGTPSLERVEQATDKVLLNKLASEAGLRAPPTKEITNGDKETIGAFGFPAIVKPPHSRILDPDGTVSAYPVRFILSNSDDEAQEALADGKGLVQPYIPGSLVSVAGVSWEGDMVCAVHQVATRIWPITVGGSSYAETVPPNTELEQGVRRLLQALDWSGLFQVQFIHNEDGEYYLIDLNPRIYGTLALAVAAGLNLPAIWVDLLLGRRPEVGRYRVGVRYRQEEKDVRALVHSLLTHRGRGRWEALRGFLPRRDTTHAVFSLRDPAPITISAAKLHKWLGSVRSN